MSTDYAQEVYELFSKNAEWMKEFQPLTQKTFGTSLAKTKNSIRAQARKKFFVFHQNDPKGPRRLIGLVGIQGKNGFQRHPKKQKEKTIDGGYWFGPYDYTHVKGAGYIAIEALFHYLIVAGQIDVLVLAIEKNNTRSINIAKKLGMHPEPCGDQYDIWLYPEDPKNMYLFSIDKEEWKKRHKPASKK